MYLEARTKDRIYFITDSSSTEVSNILRNIATTNHLAAYKLEVFFIDKENYFYKMLIPYAE